MFNPWVGKIPSRRQILWTEEPGGLQFMGSQAVRHDWAHTHTQRTVTTETVAENCSGVRKEAQDYKAEGQGFPGGSVAKNPPAKAGGTGLITVHGDPTWHGAAKPTPHNHGACSLEPGSRNCWILHALKPMLHNRRSHCSGKPKYQNWRKAQQRRPSTAKNKLNKNYLKK